MRRRDVGRRGTATRAALAALLAALALAGCGGENGGDGPGSRGGTTEQEPPGIDYQVGG